MSWKDRLQPASFRDIPFFVLKTSTEYGRRNILHQFAYSDVPVLEDLGEDQSTFTIEGYVIQESTNNFDYFDARDDLIEALRQTGAGTLVHPYLGSINVAVIGKFNLEENVSEGGVGKFTMSFSKVKDLAEIPVISSDPIDALDNSRIDNMRLVTEDFTDNYDFGPIQGPLRPNRAVPNMLERVQSGTSMVRNAVTGAIGYVSNNIAVVTGALSDVENTIATVVTAPTNLASVVQQGLNGITGIVGMIDDFSLGDVTAGLEDLLNLRLHGIDEEPLTESTNLTTNDLNSMYSSVTDLNLGIGTSYGADTGAADASSLGGALDPIIVGSPGSAREEADKRAITHLFRNMALMNAGVTAARTPFSSYEEADIVMKKVTKAIDDQIDKLGNETNDPDLFDLGVPTNYIKAYMAMQDYRAVFYDSMNRLGASLATIIDYDVSPGAESSLTVAYKQYGDLDNEGDIVLRNRPAVKHPAFLPSNETIEILSE